MYVVYYGVRILGMFADGDLAHRFEHMVINDQKIKHKQALHVMDIGTRYIDNLDELLISDTSNLFTRE